MRLSRSVSTCVRSLAALLLILSPAAAHAATIYVQAGGDLQAAINAARPGDTILLEAGATFTGTFYLPAHGGTNYVTIRSAASNSLLPASGARMSPGYSAHLPKIQSTTTTAGLRTLAGAAYWRLMFLEFLPNVKGQGDVISLGNAYETSLQDVPHHLILDRIYIHGDPLHGQKRGIGLNSSDTVIVNSHIEGIRSVGQDTQAIGGWNGPGRYRIENNYLEAAGEVFMLGGSDPALVGMTPTDVTLRYNTLTRPLSWREPIVPAPVNVRPAATTGGSLPAGTYAYRVVARRMAGTQVARSLGSQEVRVTVGANARVSLQWDAVPHATEYLVYGRVSGKQNQYWKVTAPSFVDSGAAGTSGTVSSSATMWQVKNLLELKHARQVTISYNVMTNNWAQAQNGVAILISPRNQNGSCTWCVVEDVTLEYNLIRHAGGGIKISGWDDTHPSQQTDNIVLRHNEFSDMARAWGGNGYIVTLLSGARNVTFDHNTMVSPDLSMLTVDNAPMENFRFTNNVLRHNSYGFKGTSRATGNDTIAYYFPGSVIERNVFAGGKASVYPAGNLFPTVAEFEAHFTDYVQLDFSLVAGTDWEAAGTDSLDLGADYDDDRIGTPDSIDPPQVVTVSLPSTTEGESYSTVLQAQAGLPPYVWSVKSGALPAGLSLDAFRGVISGAASVYGDFTVTVQVDDDAGAWASRPLTLHVEAAIPPVQVSTSSLPPAVATVPYTQALEAAGGTGTYRWTLVSGALPAGITLGPNGVLTGTPVADGTSTFTVNVADAQDVSRNESRSLTLVVAQPPNKAPSVSMTPVAASVPVGATVTLAAQAYDADGVVTRVDFYVGNAFAGSADGPSFLLQWLVVSPGTYRVTAVAVDDDNARSESAPIELSTTSEIVIRASEVARMAGNYELVADVTAAGGYGLWNRNKNARKVVVAAAAPASYAEFTFYAEAGRPYHLWIRARAERDSYANDSIHVQFANMAEASIGTDDSLTVNLEDDANAGLSDWGWQDHGYGTGIMGAPVVFATTGLQTLRIQPREDGLVIDQIVLSPERYLGIAPGALKNDSTTVTIGGSESGGGDSVALEPPVVAEPVPVNGDIVIRASDVARMAGSFELVADETAAGGFGLSNPNQGLAKVHVAAAAPGSYAEFTFEAEAGKPYQLWLRARAERNSYANDSVHVQFEGMEGAAIGTTGSLTVNLEDAANAGLSGWGWQDSAYGAGVLATPVVFATSGPQTIRIQPREDGLTIDQIVLSPERYLGTSPGALKDDATILER